MRYRGLVFPVDLHVVTCCWLLLSLGIDVCGQNDLRDTSILNSHRSGIFLKPLLHCD